MLKEQFVDYTTARRLQKIDFNGECLFYYFTSGGMSKYAKLIRNSKFIKPYKFSCTAPLKSQVLDYFLNFYGLHGEIFHNPEYLTDNWCIKVYNINTRFRNVNVTSNFKTHKEAQDAIIETIIEQIEFKIK